jgi:hypothetical protein
MKSPTTDSDIELTRWLQHGRHLLEAAYGPHNGPVRITLKFAESDGRLSYLVPDPGDFETVSGVALSPLELDIVRALGDQTLPAKAIAARIRRPYDSSLRAILANLCERQPAVLQSGHNGYRFVLESPCNNPQPRFAGESEPHTSGYHEPGANGCSSS